MATRTTPRPLRERQGREKRNVAAAFERLLNPLKGQASRRSRHSEQPQRDPSERVVGSYRLGALLGRGGMGEVYEAEHRFLPRRAAVKLIRPDRLESETFAPLVEERFRREAAVTARLRSPHVVLQYDFGVEADGTLFSVMELLDGLDLAALVLRFGPMPAARVTHLLGQACRALAGMHEDGLVHRDIKPGNLFVCRRPEADFLKILDFGLVRSEQQPVAADRTLTVPGAITGTYGFMAPELILGQSPTAKADIYSLGCVAYWLLTERPVFLATDTAQLVARHLTATPLAPSRRTRRAIPPALDALVLRCLAKQPAARPDAAAIAEMLSRCDVGKPWDAERAEQWWVEIRKSNGSGVTSNV